MAVFLLEGNEPFKIKYQLSKITEGYQIQYAEKLTKEHCLFLSNEGILSNPCLVVQLDTIGADEELLQLAKKCKSSSALLILAVRNLKSNTKLAKWLHDNAKNITCNKLNEAELTRHIIRGMEVYGGRITKGACERFIDKSGYLINDDINLYFINTMIKQMAYCGNEITEKEVEQCVHTSSSEDSRELMNLLCSGNEVAFMEKVLNLFDCSDLIMLTGSMIRSFRIAYKASIVNNDMKTLGLNSYQVKYLQPLLRVRPEIIQEGLELLTESAGRMKRSFVPQKELFLITMGLLLCIFRKS